MLKTDKKVLLLQDRHYDMITAGLKKQSSVVAALLGRQLKFSYLPGTKAGKKEKETYGKGIEAKEMKVREGTEGKE